MKREIISLLLVVILLLLCITGCGKSPGEKIIGKWQSPTRDVQAEVKQSLASLNITADQYYTILEFFDDGRYNSTSYYLNKGEVVYETDAGPADANYSYTIDDNTLVLTTTLLYLDVVQTFDCSFNGKNMELTFISRETYKYGKKESSDTIPEKDRKTSTYTPIK